MYDMRHHRGLLCPDVELIPRDAPSQALFHHRLRLEHAAGLIDKRHDLRPGGSTARLARTRGSRFTGELVLRLVWIALRFGLGDDRRIILTVLVVARVIEVTSGMPCWAFRSSRVSGRAGVDSV